MPSTYTDQFWVIDPGNPPGAGSPLTAQSFEFTDCNDDGQISRNGADQFEGKRITHVWHGDTVTVELPSGEEVSVTGVTFYVQGRAPVFTPTDGTALQDAVFVSSNDVAASTHLDIADLAPACFTPGTRIDTAFGSVPVELIREGDLVQTADHGFLPVRWIARKCVRAEGRFAPVRFASGALNNTRALTVSPHHRILLSGWAAQQHCGEPEALVPACRLVDGLRVRVITGGTVDYFHLGFDVHALVRSEGIWTESHFASAVGLQDGARLIPKRGTGLYVPPQYESRAIAASALC